MRRARSVRPPWRLPRSAPEVVKAARRISESFPNGVGDDFDHACICSISPQCAGPGLFSGHRTRRAEQTWGRCFPYVLRAPEGWSQRTLVAAAWPSSRANNPCLMASGVPFPEMEEARVLADHSVLAAPTNFPPYGDPLAHAPLRRRARLARRTAPPGRRAPRLSPMPGVACRGDGDVRGNLIEIEVEPGTDLVGELAHWPVVAREDHPQRGNACLPGPVRGGFEQSRGLAPPRARSRSSTDIRFILDRLSSCFARG